MFPMNERIKERIRERIKERKKGLEQSLWVSATAAILSIIVANYHSGLSGALFVVAFFSFIIAIGLKAVLLFPLPGDQLDNEK